MLFEIHYGAVLRRDDDPKQPRVARLLPTRQKLGEVDVVASRIEAESLRVLALRAFPREIASVRSPRCRPRVARVRNLDHASLHEDARFALDARAALSKSGVGTPRLGCSALSLRRREPPPPRAMPFAAPARRARLHLDIAADQITHLMFPHQGVAASSAVAQLNCMARRRPARR